jgi:two-component system, sensor histidine kinase and response regulator
MKFKVTFLLIFLFSISFSQEKMNRMNVFERKFKSLKRENKRDSLFIIINSFEANEKLTSVEKQFVLYYKSIYYKSITNNKFALVLLKKSLNLKDNSVASQKLYKATLYDLSDSYFTIQDFDKANFYANLALKDFDLNYETHSEYIDLHSIIGYYNFLQNNYNVSLSEYELALIAAKKYNPCKNSEVKYKIARIYSKLDQFKKAENTIFEGIKIADSCQEKVNKINSLRSYREILLENNKIKKANNVYEQIEILDSETESKDNISKFDSLESAYKTKFKDQENKSLKALNLQKENVVKRQKWALIASVIGISILLGLLFFVFKLSRKQKKSNLELEAQKIKIEENNKDLSRLNLLNQKIFSVISHDFKAPITTLKLLLSKDKIAKTENPLVAAYIKDIASQLDQSDAMLESLLDWAKTELRFEDHSTDFSNLYNCLQVVKNQLSKNSIEKEIEIKITVPKELQIQFPDSILIIVLRNILNNAIKFSEVKSIIEIFYENNALKIKDSGRGIDSKKLTKLFKQNINPGLGTNFESGFGMGLYLSSELMIKNNGSISAVNNENSLGCTFIIHFPN